MKKYKQFVFIILIFISACYAFDSNPDQQVVEAYEQQGSIVKSELPINIYLPAILNGYPPHTILGAQLETITAANGLLEMAEAGNRWTRRDFLWRLVEPTKGQRNWDAVKYYEDELINASQNNLNVILILMSTPEWAQFPGYTCGGKIKPEEISAYANFMYDLVRRYSKPPYNVKYYELWNEPDVRDILGCWADPEDPNYYGGKAYGEMLKVVYPAIKAADPEAQVLVGGLLLDCDPNLTFENKTCTPAYYLRGILEAGAKNSFDGVAFHSGDYYMGEVGKFHSPNFGATWDTTGPSTNPKAKFLKNELARYGAQDRYLVNTESGLACVGTDTECTSPTYGYEETKTYYFVQNGVSAMANGYKANIWFSVYGDNANNNRSGILTRENEPRPIYYTFDFMTEALANYSFGRYVDLGENIRAYEFLSPSEKKQWVVWSLNGLNQTINLTTSPYSIYKISNTGQPVQIENSQVIEIGLAPVFIKFN
ncbi:MAG: hypothetical protein CL609_09220 [Anaerolineaceae bacterium]|nr:hypothetical protein [Anaerolineaceae bacterium]